MLNGIAPILLIELKKLIPSTTIDVSSIPIVSEITNSISLPPIPIYLDPDLTGLYVDSENKNVDIDTGMESTSDGTTVQTNQKTLQSTVTVNIIAKKNSIGLSIVSALVDQVFKKVTSKEYSITYIHGPFIIFGGLLHGFSINARENTNLVDIQFILTSGGSSVVASAPSEISYTRGPIPL